MEPEENVRCFEIVGSEGPADLRLNVFTMRAAKHTLALWHQNVGGVLSEVAEFSFPCQTVEIDRSLSRLAMLFEIPTDAKYIEDMVLCVYDLSKLMEAKNDAGVVLSRDSVPEPLFRHYFGESKGETWSLAFNSAGTQLAISKFFGDDMVYDDFVCVLDSTSGECVMVSDSAEPKRSSKTAPSKIMKSPLDDSDDELPPKIPHPFVQEAIDSLKRSGRRNVVWKFQSHALFAPHTEPFLLTAGIFVSKILLLVVQFAP